MKKILSIIALLNLTGCASALKERCEKTNWFEHSRDVALDGRYLEEDQLIKECKGIDTTNSVQLDLGFKSGRDRYCTYENYFRKGETGEIINYKMCEELDLRSKQERYFSGLKNFCTSEVGYKYGGSGQVYKKVCLKESEEKFLPSYYRGRKEFLNRSITQLGQDIESLQKLQNQLAPQIDLISNEIISLPSPQECSTRQVYNESSKKDESRLICEEAWYIKSRRSTLNSQSSDLREQFHRHSQIISKSTEQLNDLRSELTKIPIVN